MDSPGDFTWSVEPGHSVTLNKTTRSATLNRLVVSFRALCSVKSAEPTLSRVVRHDKVRRHGGIQLGRGGTIIVIQLPTSYATGRTNFIVLWGTIVSGIRLVTEVMLFPQLFVFMVSWSLRRLVSLMNNTDTHGGTGSERCFK